MSPVGKDDPTGGGQKIGINLVIPGGDTGGPDVCRGFMRTFGRNDEENEEYLCGVPMTDHRKVGETEIRRVVGDTRN